MKHSFGIFAIDITQFLSDEMKAKVGKLVEVYVSDMVETHCCEITPSYELRFLRLQPENVIDDATDEELNVMAGQCEEYIYMHVSAAMNLVHEIEEVDVDSDTLSDEFEEYRDRHQCNYTFYPFKA